MLSNTQIAFFSILYHQLASVLREVKYLGMLKNTSIPKAALHLYSKQERLYVVRQLERSHFANIDSLAAKQTVGLFNSPQQTQTLTLVTQWYNQLQVTILDVELGLVKKEMEEVRQQLSPALGQLTWAQDNLWDYIQSTRDLVQVPKSPLQS